ncbi:MAG: transposase family protein [Fibromonadaceae bacterium]|jgi:hypothetical protein|nr:transposase family protein [Fibromonadaceae bacterium]
MSASAARNWLTRTWVSLGEAARLEGIDERTIRNQTKVGMNSRYVWRLGEGGNKEIRLSSLSGDAIQLYEQEQLPDVEPLKQREDTAEFCKLFHSSPDYVQKHCLFWTNVLLASSPFTGTISLGIFVHDWNSTHPEKEQISLPRLYAVRKLYKDNGYDRSFLLKERHVPQSKVKEEWLNDFKDMYLRQQGASANDCRIYALGKARMRGENVTEECFPSLAAFYRAAGKIGEGIKTWHRGGAKKFYDDRSLYIERDYSQLQAGWCWVGDTRTWDVLVNVPGFDALKRPYITMFVDLRTDMPMGWHVHHTPPSAANALTALRNGIKHHGLPNMLYVDNGREYRNKDFSGNPRGGNNWGAGNNEDGEYWMRSAASILGIDMKFAIAKNPRTKTVENSFGVYKKIIDKSFRAYFGGNPIERPEQIKAVMKDASKAPSLAEFKSIVEKNLLDIIPNYPCQSKRFVQRTRKEAWEYLYAQRVPMKSISGDTLDMIPTLTEECTIGRNGASIAKLGVSWYAEWMPSRKGESIIVRYNPQDLSKAWGYDKKKQILGEMGRPHVIPAIIDALPLEEQELSKAKLAEAMAAQRRERKTLRDMREENSLNELDILEAREYALGLISDSDAKTNAVPGPVKATKHDLDKDVLAKESRLGDPGLLEMLG